MVAVTTTSAGFGTLPYLVPPDHTLGPGGRRPRLRSRRLIRRLRALLLLSLVVLAVRTLLAFNGVPGGHGDAPLGVPEPVRASAVSPAVHIVQPGETLWSIARELQPSGDVRPLVDRLSASRHGRPLRVGERLELSR